MTLSLWFVLIACLVAVYSDVRQRRIPDWLTGALAVSAIGIHVFVGLYSLLATLLIMAGMTVFGSLIYSRRIMGGGDIKLAIAASAALGYPLFVSFLLYTMLGGGILAIAYGALRRNLKQTFKRVLLPASPGSQAMGAHKGKTMPYAVAFSFGAAILALSQTVAPFLRMSL